MIFGGRYMKLTLSEIRDKEIISLKSGTKLGFADYIVFDTDNFTVKSLVIFGRARLFGLLGRDDDIMINAEEISVIGTDTVLVKGERYISTKETADLKKSLCK